MPVVLPLMGAPGKVIKPMQTPLISNLAHLLEHHAALHPDAVAFIDGGRKITYREFGSMVRATSAWLSAQGVVPGSRVAVWLVNRMEWMALFFGLCQLGAALMTVNTRYRSHELEYILRRSEASLLVLQLGFRSIDFPGVLQNVDPDAAKGLARIAVVDAEGKSFPAELLGQQTVSFDLRCLPDIEPRATRSLDSDAVCILFTTSGTTSEPKLVMHTQRTVALQSQRIASAYGFDEDRVKLLATLPLCGVFGFNAALATFAAAKPVVLMDTFEPAPAAELIRRHKVTHLFGSDEMYRRLLDVAESATPFPSLRVAGFASFSPNAAETAKAGLERHIPMSGVYGSSEVQALFSLQRSALPLAQRIEAGGAAANHDAVIRIRDIDTRELLPPGSSGAIEIWADTNFIGYLNDSEATQAAIAEDGYFRTGDIGYLRKDGSLVYQTRLGDAMRIAGYLVSPAEIEHVLRSVPGVSEVQVVGVETMRDTRAVAFVIPLPGCRLDETEMLKAAAEALAAFKLPAHIWIVDAFPEVAGPNGTKIQRGRLREMAQERLARKGIRP